MNLSIIRLILGRLLWMLAGLLCLPMLIAIGGREPNLNIGAFIGTISLCIFLGFALRLKPNNNMRMYAREGFLLVALAWILLSLFGALPFYISGQIPSYVDALFETASGFTTTGASILTKVEALSNSMLFWRSLTHLIGGMGVLVFVLAIMPSNEMHSSSVYVMKAEVPGPTFGKMLSKLKDISRMFYLIYLIMTAVLVVLLRIGKMSWFDAFIHAFGTAGTGGFSNHSASIYYFNSNYIEIILTVGMLVFSLNISLFYLLAMRQFKIVCKNEELRWFLGIVCIAIGLISFNLWSNYQNHWLMLKDVAFTVSSIISTTGFATVDFAKWPLFSQVIILILMIMGGCAGSTAGGFKISRVMLMLKTIPYEIKSALNSQRLLMIHVDKRSVSGGEIQGVQRYFVLYILMLLFIMIIISPYCNSLLTAFSTTLTTLNNVGPGLDVVGPTSNFAAFPVFPKLILIFSMLTGRLEILPMLILFSPRAWRRG